MRRKAALACLVASAYAGLAVWLSLLAVYLGDPVVPGLIVGASYGVSGLAVRGVLPRQVLAIALLALAAGSALVGFGWPSWTLIAIGIGLLRPGLLAVASTLFADPGEGAAVYNGALNVGWLLGGVAGDLLRAAFGWSAMFNIVAVVFALSAALSIFLGGERLPPRVQPAQRPTAFAITLLILVGLYAALSAQSNGVAPLVLESGSGVIHAGMLASLHAALVAGGSALWVLGRMHLSANRARIAGVGLLVASVSFLIVASASRPGSEHIVGYIVVFGLAEAILTPTVLSFAGTLPSVQRVLFWWVHGFGFLAGALLAKAWRPLGTRSYFALLAALCVAGLGMVCAQWRDEGWQRS